jgi:hypothetical protein
LKQVASIFFLIVFAFNQTGIFVAFKIQQHKIKKEIKRQLKSQITAKDLHHFVFSISDYHQLNWEKRDKEFQLGKQMFDIVRKLQIGDSIQLDCINDEQEANLFANLDVLLRKKASENSSTNESAEKLLKLLSSIYLIEKNITKHHTIKYVKLHNCFSNFYASPIAKVESPPPQNSIKSVVS